MHNTSQELFLLTLCHMVVGGIVYRYRAPHNIIYYALGICVKSYLSYFGYKKRLTWERKGKMKEPHKPSRSIGRKWSRFTDLDHQESLQFSCLFREDNLSLRQKTSIKPYPIIYELSSIRVKSFFQKC